ncbi:hypothetical protein V6N12_049060 [Hibiscus sabdariffa]|uniref:Reverse transcriptase zinc-binding domain-containing protein n=1 Tax=Hibiscus sabdariffa TaxID=183260 RepID=A0ABR2EJ33_9ROSI
MDGTGNWDRGKLCSIFQSDVVPHILSIKCPDPSDMEDQLIWRWTPTGKFTTRSAYSLLSRSFWEQKSATWKHLWDAPVPQRLRLFLWVLFRNKLMTNVERCRRHFGHSSMCAVCNAADESILHVLRDCIVASAVWQRLAPSSPSPEFSTTNLQLWVINNLSSRVVHPEGGMPWPTLFISTLWQLWKSRNDWVFNNVMLPIEAIRNRAITWARYYLGVDQQAPPTASLSNAPCLWKRPESDCKEAIQMLTSPLANVNSSSLVRAIVKLCKRVFKAFNAPKYLTKNHHRYLFLVDDHNSGDRSSSQLC